MAIKYFIIKMCSYDFRKGNSINSIQLEKVTFYKELGIIFENNLLFNINILIIFVKKLIFLLIQFLDALLKNSLENY